MAHFDTSLVLEAITNEVLADHETNRQIIELIEDTRDTERGAEGLLVARDQRAPEVCERGAALGCQRVDQTSCCGELSLEFIARVSQRECICARGRAVGGRRSGQVGVDLRCALAEHGEPRGGLLASARERSGRLSEPARERQVAGVRVDRPLAECHERFVSGIDRGAQPIR